MTNDPATALLAGITKTGMTYGLNPNMTPQIRRVPTG